MATVIYCAEKIPLSPGKFFVFQLPYFRNVKGFNCKLLKRTRSYPDQRM